MDATNSTSPDAYFAQIAHTYDRLQPVLAGPGYEAGLAFLLDLIPHGPDAAFTCVELGCGTATLTQRLLAAYPHARAIAFDSEPAMLDVARAKLLPYADRAELRQADLLACDVPPCDVALSSYVFHHVPPDQLVPLLARLAAALTPNGCLAVLDQMQAGPDWGDRLRDLSRRAYRRRVEAAIAAGLTTEEEIAARWELKRRMKAEGKEVEYRHHADDLCAAMTEAGFSEVGLLGRWWGSDLVVGIG